MIKFSPLTITLCVIAQEKHRPDTNIWEVFLQTQANTQLWVGKLAWKRTSEQHLKAYSSTDHKHVLNVFTKWCILQMNRCSWLNMACFICSANNNEGKNTDAQSWSWRAIIYFRADPGKRYG